MSNIGYREIIDFGELSLKQLNDNLRALWSKVMGDIKYRDFATDTQEVIDSKTDEKIETAVTDLNMAQYSTLTQTASAIESAVTDMNLSQYATLTQTASAITAALADTGNVTTVKIAQGTGLTITQSGTGSYFRANATQIGFFSPTNALLGGFDASGDFVASALRDPGVSSSFKIALGQHLNPLSGDTLDYGLTWRMGSIFCGGIYCNSLLPDYGLVVGSDEKETWVTGSSVAIYGGDGANAFFRNGHAEYACDAVASSGNTYNLGGSGVRWRRLYANMATDVSSDARLKKEIAPLHACSLLSRLKPRRFRLIADDQKLRFGFIAQEVRQALEDAGLRDAELLDEENPESLGLVYGELIAVLVEGIQSLTARVEALEARLGKA